MNLQTCCFVGMNPPKLPYGGDRQHPGYLRLKLVLVNEIERLIHSGVTTFLTGMIPGPDTWCAEFVLEMKKQYSDVKLIAYLPYENQALRWPIEDHERYYNTLMHVDGEIMLQRHYTSDCIYKHRRALVDATSFMLAVDDGSIGRTKYMLDYAGEKGLGIVTVHPVTLERKYTPGTK